MARVLVIEDEDEVRAMLGRVLERAGYEVEIAPDGEDGIRQYHQKPADLIITDIIMPKKGGMETILDLKSENPGLKIIAMSGGGRAGPEPYLEIAEGLGAVRIFSKPFRIEELLFTIQRLLIDS